ncbi:MAG: class I SAM-dependent methyltransferase [Blastocatellia bacterium]
MISPENKRWNSATTLYIARKIEEVARGRSLKVLDMGCGDGTVIAQVLDANHDLYGYDLAYRNDALRAKLGSLFDDFGERFRLTQSEREIPFESQSFDLVYANQVFEHVKYFDLMMSECARVLKPGGTLIMTLPLVTSPIEPHLLVPFAHRLKPGNFRMKYLQMFYSLNLRPKTKGRTSKEMAREAERFLAEETYYKSASEILSRARDHFAICEMDTGDYVRAKIDLLKGRQHTRNLARAVRLIEGRMLDSFVTRYIGAAFRLKSPIKVTHPSVSMAVS